MSFQWPLPSSLLLYIKCDILSICSIIHISLVACELWYQEGEDSEVAPSITQCSTQALCRKLHQILCQTPDLYHTVLQQPTNSGLA